MKRTIVLAIVAIFLVGSVANAQPPRRGQRGNQSDGVQRNQDGRTANQDSPRNRQNRQGNDQAIGDSNPLAIGASGVAWYTTWETGLAEAQRSNRPIFFMSAATTCSGVPGVF